MRPVQSLLLGALPAVPITALVLGGALVCLLLTCGCGSESAEDGKESSKAGPNSASKVARKPQRPRTERSPVKTRPATKVARRARDKVPYRSPYDVAFSPDGKYLAASDRTAGVLSLVDVSAGVIARHVALRGEPTGVVWSERDDHVYVAEFDAGSVAEVAAGSGRVVRRFKVGLRPLGLAIVPGKGLLLAANSATHTVSVLDMKTGIERCRIAVSREPFSIAVTPDESLAVVSNLLPAGRVTEPGYGAVVSLIDLVHLRHAGEVRLPPGSSTVREVAISADGRWAYIVHTVGRTNLPATQLERGWINTNALSIIDLRDREVYATLLLDQPMEGAADPWGVALSGDGRKLWVSIAGVHWLARIDLEPLHQFLDGKLPNDHRLAQAQKYSPGSESIWLRIKRDAKQRAELVNDLAALYSADLIERIEIPGKAPRGLDVSPDGKLVAAAVYFSGKVVLVDSATGKVQKAVSLGPARAPDEAQRGRIIFHDATYCFQHWLSCSTCHPGDGRVDGLNWDIPNDGIGNPKNVKSLLQAHRTPPMTWRGVRPNMKTSVRAGLFFFLLRRAEPEEVEAVQAYLRSLTPRPSPYLTAQGKLSAAALRGRKVFNSDTTGCAHCHHGELLTDLFTSDVGTRGSLDKASSFDTPSLIEIYRTGPYLHDGSAATLREVLLERNQNDKHGTTSHLSEQQIDDLVAYLKSL